MLDNNRTFHNILGYQNWIRSISVILLGKIRLFVWRMQWLCSKTMEALDYSTIQTYCLITSDNVRTMRIWPFFMHWPKSRIIALLSVCANIYTIFDGHYWRSHIHRSYIFLPCLLKHLIVSVAAHTRPVTHFIHHGTVLYLRPYILLLFHFPLHSHSMANAMNAWKQKMH